MRRHRRPAKYHTIRPEWPFAVNWDSEQSAGLVAWLPLGYFGTGSMYDMVNGREWEEIDGVGHETDQQMRFDRVFSTDYFLYSAGLLTTEPLSLTCWFNSTNATQEQAMISLGNNGSNGGWMLSASGNVSGDPVRAWKQADSGSSASAAQSASGYTMGEWGLGGAVFASTTSRTAYLNGVAGTEDTSSRADPTPDFSAVGMLRRSGTGAPFKGSLADARIYSRAISAEEMARMYDPATRWQLYYPLRRKSWSFPKVTASTPTGGPFPHYTRRRMTGGMITMGGVL